MAGISDQNRISSGANIIISGIKSGKVQEYTEITPLPISEFRRGGGGATEFSGENIGALWCTDCHLPLAGGE